MSNAPSATSSEETPNQRYQRLQDPSFEDLAHLPGASKNERGLWHTIKVMREPLSYSRAAYAQYGPIIRGANFTGWAVSLIGADANELLLVNRDSIYSSEQGWHIVLSKLFPSGLMLMDNPQHRSHRRTLSVAFKTEPMRFYCDGLKRGIERGIEQWPTHFKLYPAVKALTLDLAADAFLGLPWGPEADKINKAFMHMVQASVSAIRTPIPGTPMWRGVKGREFLCRFFEQEIPKRRGGSGEDFFSQFCNARDEQGEHLSNQEVVDHMNFLMMAAHDTLTSSLTSTVYFLAANPEWQDWVLEEITANPTIKYDNLNNFDRIEMAFKEAMRLNPPVPVIPRRATADFTFQGYTVPAGTMVTINPMLVHRLPEFWPDPERYDPTRFSPENSKDRHRYAYVPFGGGAHMCLGLHFAYMQAKIFLHELLSRRRLSVAPGYTPNMAMFPLPRPRDGLPITMTPR